MCVGVLPARVSVYSTHAVAAEIKAQYQIPGNSSYKSTALWMLRIEPEFCRSVSALNH